VSNTDGLSPSPMVAVVLAIVVLLIMSGLLYLMLRDVFKVIAG
jgi:hypothetical protein